MSEIYDIHENLLQILTQFNKTTYIKQFESIPENYNKINYVEKLLTHFEQIPTLERSFDTRIKKNNEKSLNFRKEGNNFFSLKNGNYVKAMECYNKSICFAEKGSDNLSIGYANRSAILFQWKRYKECLENIRLAREAKYPQELLHKLDRREERCHELYNSGIEIEEFKFSLTHEKHPVVPFISKCLDIKYDDHYGRSIYTKEKLNPGDVVCIEEAFCTHLLPTMKYVRCTNCNIENYMSLIPCPNCTYAMYCSVKCMEEGLNNFHKFECDIIDILHKIFDKVHLSALRLSLRALSTFDNVEEFMQFCDDPDNQNKDAFDIDYDDFNQKEHYRAIHGLKTNEEKYKDFELFHQAVISAVLKYLLLKYSPLRDILVNESQRNFFTNLLFKYLLTSESNLYGMTLIEKDNETHNNYYNQCFATAVYAFSCLLNHSCAPNTMISYRNTTSHIYVIRPIPANGMLFFSYGLRYSHHPKQHRQEMLQIQQKFLCDCEACINNYPVISKLAAIPFLDLPRDLDLESFSLFKEFLKNNYERYCNYLNNYAKYYPCLQISFAESIFWYTIQVLNDAVPLKYRVKD